MTKTKILITGAGGQLGQCFQKEAEGFSTLNFTFATSNEVDLTSFAALAILFRENHFDYCINCAAYTNVEKAETQREMAFLVNSDAVANLAEVCRETKTILVHFSTDYVFDGKKNTPYKETDTTNPINVYGASKLAGEMKVQQILERYFIFRVSWLYSDIGKNFFNTILSKSEERIALNITSAQTGTPTNAYDLARFILEVITSESNEYGLYHFSNLGKTTWYGFAREIIQLSGKSEFTELTESESYSTIAARPENAVLSKEKVLKTFKQDIPDWKDSLKSLLQ